MSDLPLVLEPETPDDAEAIQHLNERVFGPGRFARTAYRIRERADPDPSLSFVARVGTLMVGANAMTPIVIGKAKALLLGPLIVEPVFRSQGIGEALVAPVARGGEGGRLDARHPGRRRALLCARRVPARSRRAASSLPGPVDPARVCSIANSSPGRSRRPRARRGPPEKTQQMLTLRKENILSRAPFCRIADFSKQ